MRQGNTDIKVQIEQSRKQGVCASTLPASYLSPFFYCVTFSLILVIDKLLSGNRREVSLVLDAVVLFNGIDAVLQDRRVRLLVTDQGVDQRRFAGAGSAEQKDEGIRGNVQGDIF